MFFMTTIQLKKVTKNLGGHDVIRDVSMVMHSGQIYGLQGINGSGKTMLMRLICGLIRPTRGEIRINDEVLGREITFPKSAGLLLESPAFLDMYSGFDNLKLLALIQMKIGEQEIRDTLRSVGLDPNDKKKYRKYSLGMKQRLGIAAAIMEAPDIVVLDEPTNALDTSGVEMVKEIILAQKKRGALVIISCHDLTLLRSMADEIFVLEAGSVTDHLMIPDTERGHLP